MSQRKYILDLLKENGISGCQPIDILIEQSHGLEELFDQVPIDKGRYQRLVRCLIYLSHMRSDLTYVVCVVSRFMHNPSKAHMNAIV